MYRNNKRERKVSSSRFPRFTLRDINFIWTFQSEKQKEEMKTEAEQRRGGDKCKEFTNLDASTGLFRLRPITSISLLEHFRCRTKIKTLETGRTAGRKPTIDVRRSLDDGPTERTEFTDGFCRCRDNESAT